MPEVTKIENKEFTEERALEKLKNATIYNCQFGGPVTSILALTGIEDCVIEQCFFSRMHSIGNAKHLTIIKSRLLEGAVLSLRNCRHIFLDHVTISADKTIDGCDKVQIFNCLVRANDFCLNSNAITLSKTKINGTHTFKECHSVDIGSLQLKGDYAFENVDLMHLGSSIIESNNCLWKSRNIEIYNSKIKGDYIGWYCENVTLVKCKIIGTQPFCYANNIKMIDCVMEDCDNAFEGSSCDVEITGKIISVKNPKSGKIVCDAIDEIIDEATDKESEKTFEVIIRKKQTEE